MEQDGLTVAPCGCVGGGSGGHSADSRQLRGLPAL